MAEREREQSLKRWMGEGDKEEKTRKERGKREEKRGKKEGKGERERKERGKREERERKKRGKKEEKEKELNEVERPERFASSDVKVGRVKN